MSESQLPRVAKPLPWWAGLLMTALLCLVLASIAQKYDFDQAWVTETWFNAIITLFVLVVLPLTLVAWISYAPTIRRHVYPSMKIVGDKPKE